MNFPSWGIEVLPSKNRRKSANCLLALGAAAGLILASTDLLNESEDGLPDSAVARVNNSMISRQDYLEHLSLLARDKRMPLTDKDRRHVLERIIEEKLLLLRGLEIDLPNEDPRVRKLIIETMIQVAIADTSSQQATEEELRRFYEENKQYFLSPARIRVQRMIFRKTSKNPARARAELAVAALRAGEQWSGVEARLADSDILRLPNTLLPPQKLRAYLGPSLTDVAMGLSAGDISEPIEGNGEYSIISIRDKQLSEASPLEDIREQIENEYTRRSGDRALREYLKDLRKQATMVIDEKFVDSLSDEN